MGVYLPARHRHDHDDLSHAGHLGGHGIHQHRGWIRRLAAGNVNPHPVQRPHHLSEEDVLLFGGEPGLRLLLAVESGDALRRQLQRPQGLGADGRHGRLDLFRAHLQGGRAQLQTVKAGRVVEQRLIPTLTDIGNDVGHDLFDIRLGRLAPVKNGLEGCLEIGIAESQHLHA